MYLHFDLFYRCNTLRKLTVNTNSPVKQKPSWLTWGYDTFLKTPVTWGISYLSTDQTSVRDVKYVVLDVLRVGYFVIV
jgi:hypothetical protein